MTLAEDAQSFDLLPVTLVDMELSFCDLVYNSGVCAPNSRTLYDFETATGLVSVGGATGISEDGLNFTQGVQGVSHVKDGTSSTPGLARVLGLTRDHTTGRHRVSFFVPDLATLATLVSAEIRLSSSGSAFTDYQAYTIPQAALRVGLNLLAFDVTAPSSVVGAPVMAAVDTYGYFVDVGAPATLLPAPVTWDDHLVLGLPGDPCYNTRRTCQDPEHFFTNQGTKIYRFTSEESAVIAGLAGAPILHAIRRGGVQLVPTEIDQSTGYGRRDHITVTFTDFKDGDETTDPYLSVRSNPPQGTYFRKLVARNQFFKGRRLVIYEAFGRHDGAGRICVDLNNALRREYVIERVDGPNRRGQFKVVAKDVLKLLDGRLIPRPSEVTLKADIDDSVTTFELAEGVQPLLDQWSEAGFTLPGGGQFYIAVDKEIMLVTASTPGSAFIDTVVRGQLGSEKSDHEAEATVQLVQSWVDLPAVDIWEDIQDQANIEPSLIALAEAQNEQAIFLSEVRLESHIARPTEAKKLMRDLNEQLGSFTWWDSEDQNTRFRPTRPPLPGEIVRTFSDTATIQKDTVEVTRAEDERFNTLLYYLGIDNWAEDLDKTTNFQRLVIFTDAEATDRTQYDDLKTRRIFGYFVPLNLAAVARSIAARYVARFRDPPEKIKLRATAKDAVLVKPGDIVNLDTFALVDFNGAQDVRTAFVVAKKRLDPVGILWEYDLVSFAFALRFGFWCEDGVPDYVAATEQQKLECAFWADEDCLVDGDEPYLWV